MLWCKSCREVYLMRNLATRALSIWFYMIDRAIFRPLELFPLTICIGARPPPPPPPQTLRVPLLNAFLPSPSFTSQSEQLFFMKRKLLFYENFARLSRCPVAKWMCLYWKELCHRICVLHSSFLFTFIFTLAIEQER